MESVMYHENTASYPYTIYKGARSALLRTAALRGDAFMNHSFDTYAKEQGMKLLPDKATLAKDISRDFRICLSYSPLGDTEEYSLHTNMAVIDNLNGELQCRRQNNGSISREEELYWAKIVTIPDRSAVVLSTKYAVGSYYISEERNVWLLTPVSGKRDTVLHMATVPMKFVPEVDYPILISTIQNFSDALTHVEKQFKQESQLERQFSEEFSVA